MCCLTRPFRISGLDWVRTVAGRSGRPSVINMSLGGQANIMINQAVQRLTSSGVHVAVAAGNDNAPAELTSPASEKTACTVGASDINDARASFSNYGTPVKIFAPGVTITSAWKDSDTVSFPFCSDVVLIISVSTSGRQDHFRNIDGDPSYSWPYCLLDHG